MTNLKNILADEEKRFDELFFFLVDNNDKHKENDVKKFLFSSNLRIIEHIADIVEEARNLPPSSRGNVLDFIQAKLRNLTTKK